VNVTGPMLFGINLAMRVYWSPDGDAGGALNEPNAHVSCLWTVADDGQTSRTKTGSVLSKMDVSWSLGLFALVVGLSMV
jgi:hypothetical protein